MVTRPESVGDHVTSSTSISDSDDAAARRAFHRSEHPRSLSGGKTFYSIENQADGSFRAKNPRTSSQKRRGRQRVSEDSSAAPEISRKTSGLRARGKRSSAASAIAKRESTSSASRNQNGLMLAPDESRSDKPPSVLPSVTLTGSNIEAPELNDRSTAPPDLTPRPARSPSQKRQGRQRHSRELSESKTALTAAIIHLAHIAEITKTASPTAGSHVPSELVTIAASTEQPSQQVVSAPEAPPRTDGLPDATADMSSTPNTDDGSTAAATSGPSLLVPPPGAATSTPPAIPTGSTGSTLSLGAVMDSIDAILRELATFSEESKASGSNTGHNTAHQQQPPEQQTTTFRGTEAPTDVQRTRSESMRAAMIQPLTEGFSAATVNMIIRDGAAAQLKPPPGTALSSASHEATTPDSTAHVGELNTSAQDHAERPPNRYGDRMLRACELSADLPSAKRREHKTRLLMPNLVSAAAHGSDRYISLMLRRGADVNAVQGEDQSTALHKAALWGHRSTVLLLLEAGADALALDRHHRTPLMCAAQSGGNSSAQILRDILDYVPPVQWRSAVNAVDKLGNTAAHYAVRDGHFGALHLLLHYGGSASVADTQPLLEASQESSHVRCYKLLVKHAGRTESS